MNLLCPFRQSCVCLAGSHIPVSAFGFTWPSSLYVCFSVSSHLLEFQSDLGSTSIQYDPILCVCVCELLSRVQLCNRIGTVAPQAPVSMGFSRQEYWSGLPCPPPGDLSNPGMGPCFLCLLHCGFFTTRATSLGREQSDDLRSHLRKGLLQSSC